MLFADCKKIEKLVIDLWECNEGRRKNSLLQRALGDQPFSGAWRTRSPPSHVICHASESICEQSNWKMHVWVSGVHMLPGNVAEAGSALQVSLNVTNSNCIKGLYAMMRLSVRLRKNVAAFAGGSCCCNDSEQNDCGDFWGAVKLTMKKTVKKV